jgi:hypothetical protein
VPPGTPDAVMAQTGTGDKKAVPQHHAGTKGMRSYSSYSFLTLELNGVSGQRHADPTLLPGKYRDTHCTGGLVGLRTGLDTEARGKVRCLCRRSNPGRPVCSQTLYFQTYPSSSHCCYNIFNYLCPLWCPKCIIGHLILNHNQVIQLRADTSQFRLEIIME